MISVLKVSDNKELFMFINQILSPFPSLECPSLLVLDHLFVPVGQHVPAEPAQLPSERGLALH